MRELSDFEFSSTKAVLGWAFRVCRESAQGVNYAMAGGGNQRRMSEERAVVLQEASRVVTIVDRKLPALQRALVRFCYARESDGDHCQNQSYNVLHNWAWRCLAYEMVAVDMVASVRVLSLMVPHEVRMRLYGMKRAFSLQQLADMVEMPKTSFRRDCQPHWCCMVERMMAEASAALEFIEGSVQQILSRRESSERDRILVAEIAKFMRERDGGEVVVGAGKAVNG